MLDLRCLTRSRESARRIVAASVMDHEQSAFGSTTPMSAASPDGNLPHLQHYAQSFSGSGQLASRHQQHLYGNEVLTGLQSSQYGPNDMFKTDFNGWPQQQQQPQQFHHQQQAYHPTGAGPHHQLSAHVQQFSNPLNQPQQPISNTATTLINATAFPPSQESHNTWNPPFANGSSSNTSSAPAVQSSVGESVVQKSEGGNGDVEDEEMEDPFTDIKIEGAPGIRFISYKEIDATFWGTCAPFAFHRSLLTYIHQTPSRKTLSTKELLLHP